MGTIEKERPKYKGIEILYEDNHILVCVKPPNMPTQRDSSGDLDLLTAMKEYIKQTYHKPGEVYLGLVHRLDRPASGLMVFARTSKAASRLSDAIRKGGMEKYYQLRCNPAPPEDAGRLVDYIKKDADGKAWICDDIEEGAKRAELEYVVTRRDAGGGICEVNLLTGRKHQIRLQFASRGWPLVGDARYGRGKRQLALFCFRLCFVHPVKKEYMEFFCPPPEELFRAEDE